MSKYTTTDGEPVPRVSDIFDKIDFRSGALERAAAQGTQVHAMIAETYGAGKAAAIADWMDSSKIKSCVADFYRWRAERPHMPLGAESEVVSDVLRVGGTFDLFAVFGDGRARVVDFKTGSHRGPYWLKLATYALLIEDVYGVEVTHGELVYLGPKAPKGEPWRVEPLGDYKIQALRAIAHWHATNRVQDE